MSEPNSLIGQSLGKYEVIRMAGEGGMATVFLARQPGLDRDVALKILAPGAAGRTNFGERFTREAQAIGSLHHPNILPVYDFGQDRGYNYIAMRYVPGAQTLADRMKQPLTPPEFLRLAEQVAAALDHAHKAGIIHRDIKPSNVLLDNDWVLLSDFGLAKTTEGPSDLTGSGVGLGTPAYMSPEQARGLPLDHRTDIYSLAIIVYEMLTGQVPHKADTPMGTVIKRVSEPMERPSRINPAIPVGVEQVLLKALAKDPTQRHNSAGEFVAELKAAYEPERETPAQSVSQQPVATTAPPPAQQGGIGPLKIGLMGFSALAGLCGVSGVLLSFTRDDTGAMNIELAPVCLGIAFAGFTGLIMVGLRNRRQPISAWLLASLALWGLGTFIMGFGGFSLLDPGDMALIENAAFSTALCFVPGLALAGLGVGAYFIDWRGGRRKYPARRQQQEHDIAARGQSAPAQAAVKPDPLDEKLRRAAEYRKEISRQIKQKEATPFADQLAPIGENLMRWETHLRQLTTRLRNYQQNHLLQRELVENPQTIERIERELQAETDLEVRREIEQTLDRYRAHQRQLDSLAQRIRRTELDIDETVGAIATIYSQLQLLDAKRMDRHRASRISIDVKDQSDRVEDMLQAMDEVYDTATAGMRHS
jgi:flagellar biosynthesis chaperone FliJ